MRTTAGFTVLFCFAGILWAEDKTATCPTWDKIDEGVTATRDGSVLLHAPDRKQLLLVGPGKGPFVQAFDPATKAWSDFAAAGPTKDAIHPYYQSVYDPGTKTVYCLSGGSVLYAFDTAGKTWKTFPPAPELDGLSWHALACDPAGKRLVLVGSDKKVDNLGWLRTVVLDLTTGKWSRLDVTDERIAKDHKGLVAATEALIDLGGRIRLAWYRDPKGVGTEAELKALQDRCAGLKKLLQMGPFAHDVDRVATLIAARKTCDSLKATRVLQRKIEEAAEAQYPVPCSRRNAPLAYDAKNKVFVLFGGDHEDYLLNDTWLLDLDKKTWRRARPELSPSPRAGHALVYLPRSNEVALYEGYAQSNSTDYGARP
jgi:hypothetical protein